MAIDPTIPLNANAPQQTNPLALMSQYAQTGNALANLQATRQKIAAQTALGRAAQDAISPDGTFSADTFFQDMKSDPNAAYAALEGVQDGQKAVGNQFGLNQAQLAQTTNRTNAVGAGMAGLLSKGDLTPADIFTSLGGQANSGKPVGEFVQSVLPSMPTMGANESQTAYSGRLKSWLAGVAGQSAGPDAAIRVGSPNIQTVGLGGTTQTMDTNPYTNPNATNTTLQNTLSPEGQATPVPGPVGPQGQHTTMPRSAYAASNGLGNLLPGGSPFGTGRPGGIPSSLLNPNGPSAGQGAAPGATGGAGTGGMPAGGTGGPPIANGGAGGGMQPAPAAAAPMVTVTDLGAGQTADLAARGTATASQEAALTGPAADIPARKAMLSSMESDLANAPTGPSSQTQNYWSAFANRNFPAISNLMPGVFQSPADVASYENFEKMTGKFAQNQAQALGGVATGDKLSATAGSNPNVMFSTLGNQGVIHLLQGNEDALNVKNQAWSNYLAGGGDPSTFTQWSSNFNNSGFDPRVFWMKNMTPDERSRTLATFTPTQAKQFYGNMRTALGNGWVSSSDFGGGTSPSTDTSPSTADMAINPTGTGN